MLDAVQGDILSACSDTCAFPLAGNIPNTAALPLHEDPPKLSQVALGIALELVAGMEPYAGLVGEAISAAGRAVSRQCRAL